MSPTLDRKRALAVLIALLAVSALGFYLASGRCTGRIVACCLTQNSARIVVESPCSEGLEVKIRGPGGELVDSFPVKPGENLRPVSLPTLGEYTVELTYHGRKIDEVRVRAEEPPGLAGSAAALWINGTLILKTTLVPPGSCMAGHIYITKVAVYPIGETGRLQPMVFSGKWPLGGVIKIQTGLTESEVRNITAITVVVTDNLNRTTTIPAMVPR